MTTQLVIDDISPRRTHAYPVSAAAHRADMARRELAALLELIEQHSGAFNVAQRSIARRLDDELRYLAGILAITAQHHVDQENTNA